jgi:hypothetical protein
MDSCRDSAGRSARGALRNERDDVDDCVDGALVAHDVDVAAVVDKS